MRITTTFIACLCSFLSFATSSQPFNLFVHFPNGVTANEIAAAKSELNATEIAITPVTKIRLWQVPYIIANISFEGNWLISLPTNAGNIPIQGYTTGQATVLGTELNIPAQATGSKDLNYCELLKDVPSIGSRMVKIAILDTGIDLRHHQDWHSIYLPNNLFGFNFMSNPLLANNPLPNLPQDDHGHGTQMASIMVNTLEAAGPSVSNVKIYPYKVANAQGAANRWSIFQAIDAAILEKVDVMNLSIGYIPKEIEDGSLLAYALQTASDQGIFIVSAAGNNQMPINNNSPFYPATLDVRNMLSVGASNCDDSAESISFSLASEYTNFGTGVDIYALGTHECLDLYGAIEIKKGTSHATALISAVAAQLKTYLPINSSAANAVVHCAITRAVASSSPDPFFDTIKHAVDNITSICFSSTGILSTPNSEKNEAGIGLQVFPNPCTTTLDLNLMTAFDAEAILYIFEHSGRLVQEEPLTLVKGKNNSRISTSSLSKGMYIVHVVSDKEVFTQKVMKY